MDLSKTLETTTLVVGDYLRCGHCGSKHVFPQAELLHGQPEEPDLLRQQVPATMLPHPNYLRCGRCGQQSWVAEPTYLPAIGT